MYSRQFIWGQRIVEKLGRSKSLEGLAQDFQGEALGILKGKLQDENHVLEALKNTTLKSSAILWKRAGLGSRSREVKECKGKTRY